MQNNISKDAFTSSSPPHAFPSSYPPTCHYNTFPCKSGPICFSKPEWRRVPDGETSSLPLDQHRRLSRDVFSFERPRWNAFQGISQVVFTCCDSVAITVIPSFPDNPQVFPTGEHCSASPLGQCACLLSESFPKSQPHQRRASSPRSERLLHYHNVYSAECRAFAVMPPLPRAPRRLPPRLAWTLRVAAHLFQVSAHYPHHQTQQAFRNYLTCLGHHVVRHSIVQSISAAWVNPAIIRFVISAWRASLL